MTTPTLTTLASFDEADGEYPGFGTLVADGAGDLFGTTENGGTNNDGTVFEIAKTDVGYSAPQVIDSFNNTNGTDPIAGLITDSAGDLFGTTNQGGASGDGTVFEIEKTDTGYSPIQDIASFDNTDGFGPIAGLTVDSEGDLFGTTEYGGANSDGTVFEIAKTDTGYSPIQDIASFDNTDGQNPYAGLITDSAGDLFGTTENGGTNNDGTVFEIAKTDVGYSAPQVIDSFNNTNGKYPVAGLITDSAGDLFGTTNQGGASGDGTVFEIEKTDTGYSPIQDIASFNGTNGGGPFSELTIDSAGDLFGTTPYGGVNNDGTIFEITKTDTGYSAIQDIASFDKTDGSSQAGLLTDSAGDLFGTTTEGGASNQGTVFELSNTGFAVCYLRGTHILPPTGQVAVEDLTTGDVVVTRFAGMRSIRWIGTQSYSRHAVRENRETLPICIQAEALGDKMPSRNLYVSPGHSMLIDGTLVLAEALVNGVTITQESCPDRVDYFQLDLGTHDCVIAEGTWSESFADGPSLRERFHNCAEFEALFPDEAPPEELTLCAQRPRQGQALDAALRPIVARASRGLTVGPLRGFIDRVDGPWKIKGWASDADHPELPVLLEVLVGERVLGTVLACDFRSDLKAAGIGQGRCCFDFTSPVRLKLEDVSNLTVRRMADGQAIPMTTACWDKLGITQPLEHANTPAPEASAAVVPASPPRLRLVG